MGKVILNRLRESETSENMREEKTYQANTNNNVATNKPKTIPNFFPPLLFIQ